MVWNCIVSIIKIAVREFKLDICYSKNIEQRTKDCLVSAVLGTTGVFSNEDECLICLVADQEPRVVCPECKKSRFHVHCSHGLTKCPNCIREANFSEKSSEETQFLFTQYQRSQGPECSVSGRDTRNTR